MDLIADTLMGAGALGAGLYCLILSRRLNRFNQLEGGMGGAIAVLSAQVDDMTRALELARGTAGETARTLTDLTERSEQSARRLELLIASLHDLPEPKSAAERRLRVVRSRRDAALEAAE